MLCFFFPVGKKVLCKERDQSRRLPAPTFQCGEGCYPNKLHSYAVGALWQQHSWYPRVGCSQGPFCRFWPAANIPSCLFWQHLSCPIKDWIPPTLKTGPQYRSFCHSALQFSFSFLPLQPQQEKREGGRKKVSLRRGASLAVPPASFLTNKIEWWFYNLIFREAFSPIWPETHLV